MTSSAARLKEGSLVRHVAARLDALRGDLESAGRSPAAIRAALEDVRDEMPALARACEHDGQLARRFTSTRATVASYLLAVEDLEAAGVPPGRRAELLQRGRRDVAEDLGHHVQLVRALNS